MWIIFKIGVKRVRMVRTNLFNKMSSWKAGVLSSKITIGYISKIRKYVDRSTYNINEFSYYHRFLIYSSHRWVDL